MVVVVVVVVVVVGPGEGEVVAPHLELLLLLPLLPLQRTVLLEARTIDGNSSERRVQRTL